MAEEPAQPGPDEEEPQSAEEAQGPQPTEAEIRAALDEQMRQVRVEDLLVQSVASLVNLSARRIAKEGERDLEQAKLGIDAVRAVVDLLPDEIAVQVRNALSELQVLYARTASGAEAGVAGGRPNRRLRRTSRPLSRRPRSRPPRSSGPRTTAARGAPADDAAARRPARLSRR